MLQPAFGSAAPKTQTNMTSSQNSKTAARLRTYRPWVEMEGAGCASSRWIATEFCVRAAAIVGGWFLPPHRTGPARDYPGRR